MAYTPSILDTVQESSEEAVTVVSRARMLQKPEHQSRLHRLSAFLPNLKTDTRSKPHQDQQRLPVHRKPAPAPPQYRQPSPQPPPNRAPPPASHQESTQQQPIPSAHSKKLHKLESPNRLQAHPLPRAQSPSRPANIQTEGRSRGNSLVPHAGPPDPSQTRSVSSPITPPKLSHLDGENDAGISSKLRRRSWIPGGGRKSRNEPQDSDHGGSNAWITTATGTIDYSCSLLVNGEKVPELWNDEADVFVYLFPRSFGCGPSFRVPSMVLSSSLRLINLIHGEIYSGRARGRSFDGRHSLAVDDATRNLAMRGLGSPPYTPKTCVSDNQSSSDGSGESIRSFADAPKEIHLFFPTGIMEVGPGLTPQDVQALVEIRNLFAFLTGQPLVATRACASTFKIFLSIAALLKHFEFANFDGSSYGESASTAFSFYQDELRLSDVRQSREKTLEGIILGERMRSTELYNETFAHAVGKYSTIMNMQSPLMNEVSQNTRARLERAAMDLQQRQRSVDVRLIDFDFPSLFAGIAASTSSVESKYINFKAWRSNFMSMRKQVLCYYKDLHGQWPPKASSKKNQFNEGGLNRLVLKGLYADLCSLYNFLVDREELTTRTFEGTEDQEDLANQDPTAAALRRVLSEYDQSSPPVQPPIPFDVPRIPTMSTIEPSYSLMSPKDRNKQSGRKLKDHERHLILAKSHNLDADYNTSFLDMYKQFEEKEARGKNAKELADQRLGHWIFMYAVIQSLPMLAVDAPGVQFSEGVEYFLCEPPMGNPPWMEDAAAQKMAWYGVQGGQGMVSMPSDVVNFGIDGIYRRSHCWTMAERWLSAGEAHAPQPAAAPLPQEEMLSPLQPPPGLAGGELGVRPVSRGRQRSTSFGGEDGLSPQDTADQRNRSRQAQRNSIAFGLERLPMPAGHDPWSPAVTPVSGGMPSSRGHSPTGSYGSGSRRNMSASGRGGETPSSGTKGSTFDDILGGMGVQDGKGKKKK